MAEEKNNKEKSVTLGDLSTELVKYSHEVLFPYMEERFATKDDVIEFKNEILTGQDKILQKIDILLGEKVVKDYQDKKQKKILAIHNDALKEHKILSPKELQEITKLEFF